MFIERLTYAGLDELTSDFYENVMHYVRFLYHTQIYASTIYYSALLGKFI